MVRRIAAIRAIGVVFCAIGALQAARVVARRSVLRKSPYRAPSLICSVDHKPPGIRWITHGLAWGRVARTKRAGQATTGVAGAKERVRAVGARALHASQRGGKVVARADCRTIYRPLIRPHTLRAPNAIIHQRRSRSAPGAVVVPSSGTARAHQRCVVKVLPCGANSSGRSCGKQQQQQRGETEPREKGGRGRGSGARAQSSRGRRRAPPWRASALRL